MKDCIYCKKQVPDGQTYEDTHDVCFAEYTRRENFGLCLKCGDPDGRDTKGLCERHGDWDSPYEGYENLWTG